MEPALDMWPVGCCQLPSGTYVTMGATIALPSARAILSAQYSVAYLCSAIDIWGPFCSVPAVPMIAVVLPFLIRRASSSHVSCSRKTVSGGFGVGSWAAAVGACTMSARLATNRSGGMDRCMFGPQDGQIRD